MSSNTLTKSNKFTFFCTQAATVVVGVLFSLLAFAAFIQTYTFNTGVLGDETLVATDDNIFVNIALLILFFVIGLLCVRKHVNLYKINPLYIIVIMIVVTTTLTGLWNTFTQLPPVSDSSILVNAAKDAANGNYSSFKEGANPYAWDPAYYGNYSYFAFYPFQLGYVFISEIFIRLFGTGAEFFTLKMLNVFAIDMAYLAMVMIINRLCKNTTITNLSAIALTLCFQSVFYSVFTYGTILGLGFATWSIYFVIRYIQDNKIKFLIFSTVLIIFAVLSKYNNMIIAIALVITLILHVINKKRFIALVMAALMIALPFLSQKLVIKMYEARSGASYTTETKQIEYLALGLNEGANPGWYNETSLDIMKNSRMNQEIADENAKEAISDRFQFFAEDPGYAVTFFIGKILTQFNEPSYESIWISQVRSSMLSDTSAFEESFYTGGMNQIMMFYFNFYTMIIYLGFAMFLLRAFLRKETSPENIIIPVIVLGAFIYHLLFEAKSQYIYPYFIMMIPFAMAGIYYGLKASNKRLSFIFRSNNA